MAEPAVRRAKVVLASGSPRRRVLLAMVGVDVDAVAPDVDELAIAADRVPYEAVVAVARAKVEALPADGRPTLAADTIVVCDRETLGKPVDRADAERMLRVQMGRHITVVSGVAVRHGSGRIETAQASSRLFIDELTDDRLARYLDSGAGDDKAGALAVQDAAKDFCHLVSGSRSNVYGLPLAETIDLLRDAGVTVDLRPSAD